MGTRVLFSIAFLTLAFGFIPSTWAASITFNAEVIASDGTGPVVLCVPDGPGPLASCQEAQGNTRPNATPFYAYQSLNDGTGTGTEISGFSSLTGVSPADLTFTFDELELIDFVGTTASSTQVYGDGDTSPTLLNIYRSGTLIATGMDLLLNIVTDRDISSPTFGLATGYGSVRLTGVAQDPFYEEVIGLTGGSGLLQITVSLFDSTGFTDPTTFRITGAFTIPTSAAVPEPTSLLLICAGLAGLGSWRRYRQGAE